jgi:zinc transporter ZupT
MFQSIVDYFTSIDPILAALYEFIHLVSNGFRGFFRFMFKTMNRVVFDGMLGFTGGVMVAASFEFIISYRNDRRFFADAGILWFFSLVPCFWD